MHREHADNANRARTVFTLIELLVVVAIIAILASMLLPALTRARAQAHKAACTANLKQMAVGAHMYMDSNEDMLPISTVYGQAFGPKMYAHPTLNSKGLAFQDFAREFCGSPDYARDNQAKSYGIFRCPAKHLEARVRNLWVQSSYVAGSTVATWYARNGQSYPIGTAMRDEGQEVYGLRGTAVLRPLRAKDVSVWPLFFDELVFTDDRYDTNSNHENWLNAVYLDGSADGQRPDAGWRANTYGQNTGSFVVWYLPYLRCPPMPE